MCSSRFAGGCSRSSLWRVLLLAVLLCGAMTWPLAAEQPSASPPRSESCTPESTEALQLLQQADPLLSRLIALLLDKENEIENLRSSLRSFEQQMQSDSAERQRQYEELQSKLSASEMERAKLLTLLAVLRDSYKEQSEYLEGIKAQAGAVIADYELVLAAERAKVLGWKIGGITVGIGLAALGTYELGRAIGWW